MKFDPVRLQDSLRETVRRARVAVRVPPYTAYLTPDDSLPFLNHAIPDARPEGRRVPVISADVVTPADPLDALQAEFQKNGRVPRFEFIEECYPDLGEKLERAGFRLEMRQPLMACTEASWRPAPAVEGLEVETLGPGVAWPSLRAYLDVGRIAFGVTDAPPLPETALADHWPAMNLSAALLARLEGEPVGSAGVTPPVLGLCELVGIATVPAHRGKGIAAALTSAAARVAFESGVEAVHLTPGDAGSQRIYERAGFRPVATMLAYRAA